MLENNNYSNQINEWMNWIMDLSYWCESNPDVEGMDSVYDLISEAVSKIKSLDLVEEYTAEQIASLEQQQQDLKSRKKFLRDMASPDTDIDADAVPDTETTTAPTGT